MPTVTELQLFAVDLPFKVAFRHAAAARTTSESLFLRVGLDDGAKGWGESLPRAYVSGERREDAFTLLRDSILPALLGRTFQSPAEVGSFLEKCDGQAPAEWVRPEIPQTSAWCSVDLALLDAFGRAFGEPASLGGPRWRLTRCADTATAGWCPLAEGCPMRCRCSRCGRSGSRTSS